MPCAQAAWRQPLTEAEAAEAAAVLDMLLNTSVAAGDGEALRYVQSTASMLGVRASPCEKLGTPACSNSTRPSLFSDATYDQLRKY